VPKQAHFQFSLEYW